MKTLDAQCLIVQLAQEEMPPPDLWRHERSGVLSCAYSGGTQTFTWPTDDVVSMAERWRALGVGEVPDLVRSFVDAHRRLEAIAAESGLGPADVVIHDLGRAEVRGIWEEQKMVLVVDEVGDLDPARD